AVRVARARGCGIAVDALFGRPGGLRAALRPGPRVGDQGVAAGDAEDLGGAVRNRAARDDGRVTAAEVEAAESEVDDLRRSRRVGVELTRDRGGRSRREAPAAA